MVVMKFLLCHRHNYSHLLSARAAAGFLGRGKNRRGVTIEANWDKPIDIEAMVAVAQVSARSLFRQFRKTEAAHRRILPSGFGSTAREKCSNDPTKAARVIQVALKCGFQNPGHFARDYRNSFGELHFGDLAEGPEVGWVSSENFRPAAASLVSRDRQHDNRAERFPAEAPAP